MSFTCLDYFSFTYTLGIANSRREFVVRPVLVLLSARHQSLRWKSRIFETPKIFTYYCDQPQWLRSLHAHLQRKFRIWDFIGAEGIQKQRPTVRLNRYDSHRHRLQPLRCHSGKWTTFQPHAMSNPFLSHTIIVMCRLLAGKMRPCAVEKGEETVARFRGHSRGGFPDWPSGCKKIRECSEVSGNCNDIFISSELILSSKA